MHRMQCQLANSVGSIGIEIEHSGQISSTCCSTGWGLLGRECLKLPLFV